MTSLNLAGPQDIGVLLPMVETYHQELGLRFQADAVQTALAPLLTDARFGQVFLAGPRRAPIGYVVLSHGWSLRQGGAFGVLDQIFVRPQVRRRGIGSSILSALPGQLRQAGIRTLAAEIDGRDGKVRRFLEKLRFTANPDTLRLITRF